MPRFLLFALCLLVQPLVATSDQTLVRTWTAKDGRTAEAVFLSATAETVTMRRVSDGKQFEVDLKGLSTADQEWVARILRLQQIAQSAINAHLTVFQVTDKGFLAHGWGERGPVKTRVHKRGGWVQDTGLNSHQRTYKEWQEVEKYREQITFPKYVFIRCDPEGRYDGEEVLADLIESGTYQYETVLGALSTVKAYEVLQVPAEVKNLLVQGQP